MASPSRPTATTLVLSAALIGVALGGPAPLRMPRVGPPTLPVSWANPLGTALTQVREDVWLAERSFYPRLPGLQGTDVGGKMAVIRLPDGALWVHSPVELDDELRAALAELGPVRHVVTPNTEHQKYAADWIRAYPDAISYACPGLRERKPEVGWTRSVGGPADPPPEWDTGVLDLCWVGAERVPLIGSEPFFSEVVFFHRPSRVFVCSDLYWNYPSGPDVPFSTRAWKGAMDVIYRPVYNRLLRVQPAFDTDVWSKIGRWDIDYIAPCHGEPVAEDARGVLARHLGYAAQ